MLKIGIIMPISLRRPFREGAIAGAMRHKPSATVPSAGTGGDIPTWYREALAATIDRMSRMPQQREVLNAGIGPDCSDDGFAGRIPLEARKYR